MAEQDITKIQLQLDASVKNLASLEAAEKQILALIAAYKKLSEASAAGAKAASSKAADKGAGSTPQEFRNNLADAKAELQALDKLAKNVPRGETSRVLNEEIAKLRNNITALSDPNRGAGTLGKVISEGASNAGKQVASLEGKLATLQGTFTESGKPIKTGMLESAAKQIRDLQEGVGKSSVPKILAENIADKALDRREAPGASQARIAAGRAAQVAAEAAKTESTAKQETAKASKVVAEETGKAAKNSKAVAEQTTVTTKAATKIASQAALAPTAAELQSRLGGGLRSLLSQASRDPMGPVNRPTRRELEGTSNLPVINRFGGRTLAGGGGSGGDGGATNSLRNLAAAADRASAALSRIASSTAGSARAAVGGASASVAAPRGILPAMQAELAANTGLGAAIHKTMRQQEAASNPKYRQAIQQRAASQITYSDSVNRVAAASANASKSIGGMARQQDAITGQIKNVLGMAAGYQVLQGIASELGQVFGHLKGGIMGFNSMLEQSTVGFTTLFKNQATQAFAAGEGLSEQQVLAEDLTAKIDYIRMGYSTAEGAAKGLINIIREFANVTPFRFAELQESALRMRAFGFALDEVLIKDKKTGEFKGAIVSVGNAVSALGGGADAFRRITYALGQMKQAGRVYQNDMMQLANAGIGGYKYIADKLRREITTDGSGSRKAVKKGYEGMFNELTSNAIEAVRRLTTTGKISGEAASRAIIEGLERDFGGGMKAQSRTFLGAFSTVADTSQSLVADAFLPLYESIRDTTVALGDFLQKGEVRKRAVEFGQSVTVVVKALTELGSQVMSIVAKSFADFVNILANLGNKSKETGMIFQSVFGGLANGIKTVLSLLENDMFRALILAGALTKALFAFTASNPMLTQILLITTAIGFMKTAYDTNFAGMRDSIDGVVARLEPLLVVIRDRIIPLAAKLGAAFSGTVFSLIALGFEAITPAINVVIEAVEVFLRIVKMLEGPLTAIFVILGGSFVFGKMVAGLAAVGRQIGLLLIRFDLLAQKARNAGLGLVTLQNAPYGGAGAAPLKYDGKAPTAVANLATAAERAATALLRVASAGAGAGSKPGVAAGGSAAVVPIATAAGGGSGGGSSSRIVTTGSVLSGMAGAAGAVGMISMIAGSVMQSGDEASAAIGTVVQNVGMGLMAFSLLKSVVPPGMFTAIGAGIKMVLLNLKALSLTSFPGIAAGFAALKASLIGMPLVGPALAKVGGAIAGVFAQVTVAAAAAAAGIAVLAIGAVLFVKAISDKLAEEKAKRDAASSSANQAQMNDVLGTTDRPITQEEFLAVEASKSASAREFSGGAGNKDFKLRYDELAQGKSFKVAIDQGALGLGIGMGSDDEKEARRKEQQEAVDRLAAYNKRLAAYQTMMENPMTAKYYKQARLDHEALAKSTKDTSPFAEKTADQMALLVNAGKQATKNQEYLNYLLMVAKQELSEANSLMQTLAEKTLQDILDPDTRTNPYTGLEEAGLSLEEVLQAEQDMGFSQFENSSGIVRNFEEYRGLLDSILPITDADLVNGQLSVRAVEERLKIDKERKRELKLIMDIAEAEYDFGMAQLSMYDESIDPLQRGVQMRQAQLKYTEDINKLQDEGLNIVLDEAKASKAYTAATRETKKRLQELKDGQQLILNEMKAMFTDHNTDVANILANPNLTSAQRQNAIKVRTEKLYTDLESQFGITQSMMQTTLAGLNALIDGALDNLGNPALPNINWGGTLAERLESGGYGFLTKYLVDKAVQVAKLQSAVFAGLDTDAMVKQQAVKNRDALVKIFQSRVAAARQLYFSTPGKLGSKIPEFNMGADVSLGKMIDAFSKMTDYTKLLTASNSIDSLILQYTGNRFARGGRMGSGSIGLVGEQGPELFVPRSSGMILSNSISSRLMGMLGGGGMTMAGANNVTINVNNPVIRSDNDIRKLANEISKAQASQFRVSGGRLS